MAKKTVKKSSSKARSKTVHKTDNNMTNAKAVVAFLIVMVAFGIYLIFNTYQDAIMAGNFQTFMVMAVIGSGLLIGLLYLVNQPAKKK